ncbi:ABC transporter ATP-binding protein [Pelistega sp. MC2]|uniref:ABC transporter ATP-binding protein n=1 Tax=Pelistega sp. MC2 TaxID=1720297 RepID=UPI0008D948FC|nr:ABC transporter ATP-binding protein [Pelistega sp. MC2]
MTNVLSVKNLSVTFAEKEVVRNISFDVPKGQTLAIVGESGSGKSVTSSAIMQLLPWLGGNITSGSICFESQNGLLDIAQAPPEQMRHIRGKEIAMIFQEPMTSLDPVFTVGYQIKEVLSLHRGLKGVEADRELIRLLDLVRLPNAAQLVNRYPHQLSGGMRQRVMIAMAVACHPTLLIADEPTTALDVTVQAQVLQILRDMQAELGMSMIFISHDMGVISEMADELLVMKRGEQIEYGHAREIILSPKAEYTQQLLAAVPKIGAMQGIASPRKFHIPGQEVDIEEHVSNVVMDKPLVSLDKVSTHYPIRGGFLGRVTHKVYAAENVSLQIYPGETLALVGESGSGKSTIGKTLQQLVKPTSGRILFKGENVFGQHHEQFKKEIQYVFQDPYGSLNPRKTIRESLLEPMYVHGLVKNPKQQVASLLESVHLPADVADRYPHEFSGGQKQRICIARALSVEPSLIIADEAVSALDVSVQAQVINLLMDLQAERGLAYLFISHDMAVVERISHRVAVMYLGQIVELGSRRQIFENPQHPYTKRLLSAVPVMDPNKEITRVEFTGDIPSPIRAINNPPSQHTYQEVSPGHFVAI